VTTRAKRHSNRNWKDWLDANPLKVIVGTVVAACTATAGVLIYLSGEEIKLEKKAADTKLEETKDQLSSRIKDLEARLLTIERRVGTESIWDLSALTVTPNQIKSLGSNFIYNDVLQCYLSIPSTGSWKFMETDELGLGKMLLGQNADSPDPSLEQGSLMGLAKQFKISMWRGQQSFEVKTGSGDGDSMYIFPYVAIELVKNEELFRLMGKLSETAPKDKFSKDVSHLEQMLDGLQSVRPVTGTEPKKDGAPLPESQATPEQESQKSDLDVAPEKVIQQLAEVFNSDTAGLFLSSAIMQGFMLSMSVPHSTFRVLDAEKKGNVLYVHLQMVFAATGKAKKIYWDREIICIGNSQATFVVTTSAPSIDQRPSEAAWITAWLAGLRVPLE
jgi:hypothetical protein